MKSLHSRLASGLFLSLVIAFSALWILVSINLQYLAKEYISSRLEHDSNNLLASIVFNQQGEMQLNTNRTDVIFNQPFSGHYYQINSANKMISSRSLWDQKLNTQEYSIQGLDIGHKISRIQQGPVNQSLLVLTSAYKKKGNYLTISIAEDMGAINKNINQLSFWFALLAIAMLVVLILFQKIILKRSLQPLKKVEQELIGLQNGDLQKLDSNVPAELASLINEVNHLLDIMQQRLQRSRNALGDLAHAIKKPLAVINQTVNKDTMPSIEKNILLNQSNIIVQITERILKRARLAGPGHSGARFSFKNDLPALVKTLNMMYISKSIDLNINISGHLICPVERDDMLELLGNILENAYKWAVKKVNISVILDSSICISIEDDGPGAAQDKIQSISQRGVRLDEKIQGHGFGLAISCDIVEDYNGEISFKESSSLGGFRVDIKLPIKGNKLSYSKIRESNI